MVEYFASQGINTYLNPITQDGALIHSLNMVSFPYGAKSKRPGYSAFLGTPDNAQVNSLFAFPRQDGTSLFLYRASGSILYYSQQGTGPWTPAIGAGTADHGGTIANGSHVGKAILNDTMIVGDGAGSTRHTTTGTSFVDTTLAPVANYFAQYQNAIYAAGSASTLFKSSDNDATNWSTGGTSNSTSLTVPDEGKLAQIFVSADKLIATKNRGKMFSWDGYNLSDLATRYGPSSPWSIADIEDFRIFITQFGAFGFDRANNIQILSLPIWRYFYNVQNTQIPSANFPTIPAAAHLYDYFAAVGTITDDFTQRQVSNAIINYNLQKNEWLLWQFNDFPTALTSYFDANNKRQLIFGNSSGQVFQLDPTKTTDNGAVINTELVFLFDYATSQQTMSQSAVKVLPAASFEKKWNWIRLFFNPGCEVNIQGAFSNGFTYQHLNWFDIVDNSQNPNQNASDGICEFRFPQDSRSRLLFLRIYESSPNSQWTYYGCSIDADIMHIS